MSKANRAFTEVELKALADMSAMLEPTLQLAYKYLDHPKYSVSNQVVELFSSYIHLTVCSLHEAKAEGTWKGLGACI